MNKKTLLILACILFLIGITSFLYSRLLLQKTETGNQIVATPTQTAPRNTIFSDLNAKNSSSSVSFNIMIAPSVQFPTTVPIYDTFGLSFEKNANQYAKILGFPEKPSSRGSGYITWDKDEESFEYRSPPNAYLYSQQSPHLSATLLSPEAGEKIISAFFQKIGLSQEQFKIKRTSFSYINANNLVSYSINTVLQPVALQLTYSFFVNDFAIFDTTGSPLEVTSIIFADGIKKLSISATPGLVSKGNAKILSIQEALLLLKNNKATLVSIVGGSRAGAYYEASFSSASITNISLVYIWNTKENTLIPTYLFEGAIADGKDAGFPVKYLLPALAE